ncbi:MAG: hypothetical protein ACJAQT_000301 [Akkermansiaceae bacterium]|jgi:hypothetical protein
MSNPEATAGQKSRILEQWTINDPGAAEKWKAKNR